MTMKSTAVPLGVIVCSRGELEARNDAERRTGGLDPLEGPRRAPMKQERRMTSENAFGNPRFIEMNGRKRHEHAGSREFNHKIVEVANQRDERRASRSRMRIALFTMLIVTAAGTPWPVTSAT